MNSTSSYICPYKILSWSFHQ